MITANMNLPKESQEKVSIVKRVKVRTPRGRLANMGDQDRPRKQDSL